MKIEARLDYSTILGNQARPVHLALRFEAPASSEADSTPRRPMAFCAVLDRSGSMGGAPLHHAREACRGVITNLRPGDLFALVTFDESAEVIIPLQHEPHRRLDAGPRRVEQVSR
jgi:Ca-activated chloride channel family protein